MNQVFLGLDLGEVRIGLACGSLDARIARPIGIIKHQSLKVDIEKIQKVLLEYQITNIVIGMSYQEDGTPNSMGRHSLRFGSDLQSISGLPVTYWDEGLSTRDAKANALSAGVSMKNRRGHQDDLAAAVILQSYFDNPENHKNV